MPNSAKQSPDLLIHDVTARDGLQNASRVFPPAARAALIDRLADAGVPRIQVGSFVNPRKVPQTAGTAEVWRLVRKHPGVRYDVLTLNVRGVELAVEARIPHIEIYVSATETHSMKNTGMTVRKALNQARSMGELARGAGLGVTAGVMCAFGCHYEGAVSEAAVSELVAMLEEFNPEEIGLADTTGMGTPELMERVLAAVSRVTFLGRVTLHLHDTYGMGLANLETALNLGVRRFDSSLAGLGGCPFIPGAKGNIASEQAIRAALAMGFSTGIDLDSIDLLAPDWKAYTAMDGPPPA
jgi:hydroxymethylglutaryl-CoA lyase